MTPTNEPQRILQTSTNGSGETINSMRSAGSGVSLIQVDIPTGIAGTVTLYGRLSPALPWVEVKQFTTSAIEAILACPYLRAVASSVVLTTPGTLITVETYAT